MTIPDPVDAILKSARLSLLSTMTKKGVPIVDAMGYMWEGRTIDYGTGLSYPAKAERARNNPHVGLLFHTPGKHRDGILVISADASVEDADLQATTDRWVKFAGEVELGGKERDWHPEHFAKTRDAEGRSPFEALFYWVRVFINCTPRKAYWWPDGADKPPHIWLAPSDVVAPPSDPAPSGPPTKQISAPPPPWQVVADKVIARTDLPAPYLTIVAEDGYPIPFVTDRVERIDTGFRLAVPRGAPWSSPVQAKACLSFENHGLHVVNPGGRFVGDAEQSGENILFHVDLALPVDLIMGMSGELPHHLYPPPEIREKRMARLHAELERRGASMPIVRPPSEIP
jgi:hypothetical protein